MAPRVRVPPVPGTISVLPGHSVIPDKGVQRGQKGLGRKRDALFGVHCLTLTLTPSTFETKNTPILTQPPTMVWQKDRMTERKKV